MWNSFDPATIVDVELTPHEILNMIYVELRFIGEVRCKLHDDYIDLRGHRVEYFEDYIWVDNIYKTKFTTQYFSNMVGDIWRLCK